MNKEKRKGGRSENKRCQIDVSGKYTKGAFLKLRLVRKGRERAGLGEKRVWGNPKAGTPGHGAFKGKKKKKE